MKKNPIIIKWEEPNRAQTKPLHISDRGTRYSTLTGITWLDESRYLVAHRSGLRVALFDLSLNNELIMTFELPHLVDDIASRQTSLNTWEVVVSGCWEEISSIFDLNLQDTPKLTFKGSRHHTERTFSHGVRYDNTGNLCCALHTGENPRIMIGQEIYHLPKPWGSRCVCYSQHTDTFYAVAVSSNPQLKEYKKVETSVWSLNSSIDEWKMVFLIQGMHSDACEVYDNRIWLPDQKLDRVLGICLNKARKPIILKGKIFDFPHGLSISSKGILAVTNYGNSSITLIDLSVIIRSHTESH